jgi:hypothetical protein
MTRRMVVVVCCVLLSAATMFAQSGGGKKAKPDDPISGTWTGTLTPRDAPRSMSITMELKFDGKSAVTGPVSGLPNPAEVKVGTFDAKSGALKLQLGKTSGPEVLLVLEGTVAKGEASGKVSGDGGGGEFKLTKK